MSHPYLLERQQTIARPVAEIFEFFSRAENLQAITPPWLDFRILHTTDARVRAGTLIRYALRWRGVPLHWTTNIVEWDPPHGFVDRQISGPYRLWHHEHRFRASGAQTIMTDKVTYELPLGPLGRVAHAFIVRHDVERIFAFRATEIDRLFT